MSTYVLTWDGQNASWTDRDLHRRRTRNFGSASCAWKVDSNTMLEPDSDFYLFRLGHSPGIVARGRIDETPDVVQYRRPRVGRTIDQVVHLLFNDILDEGDCLAVDQLTQQIAEVEWRGLTETGAVLGEDADELLFALWEEHVDQAGFPRSRPRFVRRPRFEIGAVYNRGDIHDHFGGKRSGSVSVPADTDSIFLFVKPADKRRGYSGQWTHSGDLKFFGESQHAAVEFVQGNLAIRDHFAHCKVLHVFEPVGVPQKFRYAGKFNHASNEHRYIADKNGRKRRAILFQLTRDGSEDLEEDLDSVAMIEPCRDDSANTKTTETV